jgi:hypothetical protein
VIVAPFLDTSDLDFAKKIFAEFYALEPVLDVTAIRSYTEQNQCLDPMMPHGVRTYMSSFAYQTVTVEVLEYTAQKYASYISALGNDCRPGAIMFENYPFEKVIEIPSDGTAYANRGRHFSCAIGLRWEGAQHDDWVKQWIKDFVQEARAIDTKAMIAQGREPTKTSGYANFHLPGDPASPAFGGNFARLTELKQKWDPNGRFNKWLSIPTQKS